MNCDAASENHWTLLNLFNLEEDAARECLGSSVLISDDGNYPIMVGYLENLLGRTFESVDLDTISSRTYACEVVLGESSIRTAGPYVYVGEDEHGQLIVSCNQNAVAFSRDTHCFLFFLMSCYSAAMVFRVIAGNTLALPGRDEIVIDGNSLITPDVFSPEVDLGEVYLAGAGAIGNSFLYALSTFNVKGRLTIADPDFVSGGNLNRCLFFTENDLKRKKVDALVEHSRPFFSYLELIPFPYELSKIPVKKENDAWLQKLVVAVDSRRARRTLQAEIPKEVFDASTTGVAEIVVHHHIQPLNGLACLGCIYYKEELENAHEAHVAETLGVTLDQVKHQFIDEAAALAISRKYLLDHKALIGVPYDTMFKQLCGEGKLQAQEDKQVLAPLAFVSALAGAFLALRFIQKHRNQSPYNYWRVSPWANPNYRLQKIYHTSDRCEFCNNHIYLRTANQLWE